MSRKTHGELDAIVALVTIALLGYVGLLCYLIDNAGAH